MSIVNKIATKGIVNPNGMSPAILVQGYSVTPISQNFSNLPPEYLGYSESQKENLRETKNLLKVHLFFEGKIYTKEVLIDKNLNVSLESIKTYVDKGRPEIKFDIRT